MYGVSRQRSCPRSAHGSPCSMITVSLWIALRNSTNVADRIGQAVRGEAISKRAEGRRGHSSGGKGCFESSHIDEHMTSAIAFVFFHVEKEI